MQIVLVKLSTSSLTVVRVSGVGSVRILTVMAEYSGNTLRYDLRRTIAGSGRAREDGVDLLEGSSLILSPGFRKRLDGSDAMQKSASLTQYGVDRTYLHQDLPIHPSSL